MGIRRTRFPEELASEAFKLRDTAAVEELSESSTAPFLPPCLVTQTPLLLAPLPRHCPESTEDLAGPSSTGGRKIFT